jgi:hypothetical protein
VAAFILAGLCPFLMIYDAVILTETAATFVLAITMFAATLAIRAFGRRTAYLWWAAAGSFAGIGVMLRPDSGLFALGIGLTIVAGLLFARDAAKSGSKRIGSTFATGLVFSAAFVAVLVPWTARNEQQFGVFQPLAPAHAEAPGEFVPLGYFHWVRTWINDQKYIGPVLWDLEDKPISIDALPATAFGSDNERQRVAALLEAYNNSDPDRQADNSVGSEDDDSNASEADDAADDGAASDEDDASYDLKISPEVDAQFEKIAEERVAAAPFHYYVELPAERASSMWFDTHSAYYPFEGEVFPMKELDGETGQNIWLPLFAGLTWLYTILAFGGGWVLLRGRRSIIWVFMTLAGCLPRVLFFATLENPEPRYLVELFLVASILGGVFLSRFRLRGDRRIFSLEFLRPNRTGI